MDDLQDMGAMGLSDEDVERLNEKYRIERDKRLRPEGTSQYVSVSGRFAHFQDDPYVAPGFDRPAVAEQVDVLIVGGGFGGLMIAGNLIKSGVQDIRIIEKAGDFGGTWYWNRYPGAACDIESYIYLPFLEEVGYIPVEKYSKAPEIFEYSQITYPTLQGYERAHLQTEVTEMRWQEGRARWLVATNRGDRIEARFVCMSAGPLHKPKLPGIPGIDSFKGHCFHTTRWDYAYTGGDAGGNLTKLSDKRVGIIGTGATAVQCVPQLARWAQHLYVFQRTPSAVGVRGNQPTDPHWANTLTPGWQKRRMENFNNILAGIAEAEDLVDDGWTHLSGRGSGLDAEAARRRQLRDYAKMESLRARIDSLVADRATAEALKPYYNEMCKRPCFHDEYLQSFNRPNVTLVDTEGRGVERLTETSAVVGDRSYELDCLIFATGFEFQTDYSRRTGYQIYGRGGISLSEKWRDGISTLFGMQTSGFPNCLIISTSQQAVTANFTHMFSALSEHIAYVVTNCLQEGVAEVEPSSQAEEEWVAHVMTFADARRKFEEACTPGFYNNEGNPSLLSIRNGSYASLSSPGFMANPSRAWRLRGAA